MPTEKLNHDQFLLSELKNGQERAFDFIFRTHYKALCAQANVYVNDLDKAQSLVQDCFIKLWEGREKAVCIKNLSSYLTFMVRNQCIDYLRSTKLLEKNSEIGEKTNFDNKTEELIMAHDFEEKLVVALAHLPDRSREAFEYSRFDGMTYKEIAEKMEVSVKAVEALVGRSLKILRKELKDFLPLLIILYKISGF